MINTPFLIHALSPLHAGTGSAADVIDLPIARYVSTGIPFLPGSSIKGVLRDARNPKHGSGLDEDQFFATFGPDTENAGEHAGAVNFGDAHLLALPVRSFRGTFAWVTSPYLLDLAKRDLLDPDLPDVSTSGKALAATDSVLLFDYGSDFGIVLQDIDVPADESVIADTWAEAIAAHLFPEDNSDMFKTRFAIVPDEVMTFLWETATQVDTRIRINAATGTVDKGALWQEETLPPETLLIGLMTADRARRQRGLNGWGKQPAEVQSAALPGEEILQFGGKSSIGRGRCRILPASKPSKGGDNAD